MGPGFASCPPTQGQGPPRHPSFKQPAFSVNIDNSKLLQIPNWIHAWETNIADFHRGISYQKLQEDIVKLENKLTYCIKSAIPEERYIHLVADWADKIAEFPVAKKEEWKAIIRKSYSDSKMFHTPLATLREIKDYCTENIEHGSIFSHTLMKTLSVAIEKHSSYLGIEPIDILGYAIIPDKPTKYETELELIKATAPKTEPQKSEYKTNAEYIRAKLKYRSVMLSNNSALELELETKTGIKIEKKTESTTNLNITGKETKL